MKNNKPLKIYLSGPYSSKSKKKRLVNVKIAMMGGIAIFMKGHYPYIPHLLHFVNEEAKKMNIYFKDESIMQWDKVWLETCDAILYYDSSGKSRGAKDELILAKDLKKIIFYSIDQIPDVKGK